MAHLRKELAQATDELKAAKEQVKETRRQTRAEAEEMEEECAVKIRQVTLQLNDKAAEVRGGPTLKHAALGTDGKTRTTAHCLALQLSLTCRHVGFPHPDAAAPRRTKN